MQTKLDQIANQHHLQLLKALLPYLPMSCQKTFSILIKTIEMRNIMDYYTHSSDFIHRSTNTDNESLIQAQENSREGPVPEKQKADILDILADIRQYCEGEEQEMIDQALQMISMIELYQVCAETAP